MTPAERTLHHDRTHRAAPRHEFEVDRLTARIAQLQREKAELEGFAAIAAHELVAPLVMAEAYATLVSERLSEPEHADSRRDLEALARGVARMRLLADSLLHDARSRSGQVNRRPVDTHAVVHDCLTLLRPEILSREARVEIEHLPRAMGEEGLLSGVFSNLLINALKYSPRQGAGIRIGGLRENGGCRYFVDSNGPTIPADEREQIFEPFRRGKDERRATGTGLGLAICRRIVERHGGTIGVSPANGRGNRFFFTLPA